jgi:hypothetical protein
LARTCENCANYEQREVGRKERRQMRRKRKAHTYQSAVQPLVQGAQPTSNTEPLQPGMERTAEQTRAEAPLDIATYLLRGAAIGTAGLCLCVPLAVWARWCPWYAPFVVFFAMAGIGILASVYDPKEWVINRVEDWLQRDINKDGQIGTVNYIVSGVLKDEHGNESYLKFILESTNGNVKWHNFCRAVMGYNQPRRNFSQNEAARQGLSGPDWKRIYQAFTAQHWLIPAKPRGTPKLKGKGWEWVKLYADQSPAPSGTELSFADEDR